jgi:hypothetical protein
MDRQAVVRVFADPVMVLAAVSKGIDMHRDAAEMRHVVEELVAHLAGDLMSLADG